MKKRHSFFQRLFWYFVLFLVIIRFFPLIERLGLAFVILVRGYGWGFLAALALSFLVWQLQRRGLVFKNSKSTIKNQSLRDVTNSVAKKRGN